jgi:prepilin-type N-terminal cleavage/methylation domain-containing protein
MRRNTQSGFSLIELLVAMMIIAVIATLGFKKYSDYSARARYLKAEDTLRVVRDGLDQYYLKHGRYPDLTSYESMVDANSPLVKENMIPVNVPAKDPWDQPFEASSGKGRYELKCLGDPSGNEDRKPFSITPDRMQGDSSTSPQGTAAPAAPAQGTTP